MSKFTDWWIEWRGVIIMAMFIIAMLLAGVIVGLAKLAER